jgi:adenylate cyclase
VLAQKATSLQSELATPALVLARISLAQWRYDDALAHARRAVDLQPGDAETHATLALALTAAGQHQDALRAVNEALRRDPRPPPAARGTVGIIRFALRDYPGAAASLGEAVGGMSDGGGWFYSPFLLAAYGRDQEQGPYWEPAFRETSLVSVRFNQFYLQAEDMRHLLDRLRVAGAQEFPSEFDARRDAAEPVVGEELAPLLYGRTFEALCWFPRLNTEFSFSASGAVSWAARHDISDSGTSRTDGDRICINLPTITRGRDACYSVFRIKGANDYTSRYAFALAGPSLCYFRSK